MPGQVCCCAGLPTKDKNNQYGNFRFDQLRIVQVRFIRRHPGSRHVDCDDALFYLGIHYLSE